MLQAKLLTKMTLITGSTLMLFAIGATLSPQLVDPAFAATDSADVPVNLYANPVISLRAPTDLSMSATPPAEGDSGLQVSHDHLRVGTNNITGYRLYISMSNDSNNTRLEHNLRPDLYHVDSITGPTAAADFPVNQWGYASSIDDPADPDQPDNFQALPSIGSSTQLRGGDDDPAAHGPVSNDPTYIAAGAKIDSTIASGQYTNMLKFTAITNDIPTVKVTFDQAFDLAGAEKITADDGNQYYRMQDMTTEICSSVAPAAGDTTQTTTLVDDRLDEHAGKKTYTVSKLRDGNCWMTDNLRLGSTTNDIVLHPEDTNFTEDVQQSFTLHARALGYSWTNTTANDESYASDAQDTSSEGFHGYNGYYYNWFAATAGSTAGDTQNASGDICPKGWSLPANYTVNPNRSYSKLLYSYNIIPTIGGSGYTDTGWNTMRTEPLRFVLSGNHNDKGGTINNHGASGHYWSSSRYSSAVSYYLYFGPSSMSPQYNTYRYNQSNGFVVRCLAQ